MKDFDNSRKIDENMSYNPDIENTKVFSDNSKEKQAKAENTTYDNNDSFEIPPEARGPEMPQGRFYQQPTMHNINNAPSNDEQEATSAPREELQSTEKVSFQRGNPLTSLTSDASAQTDEGKQEHNEEIEHSDSTHAHRSDTASSSNDVVNDTTPAENANVEKSNNAPKNAFVQDKTATQESTPVENTFNTQGTAPDGKADEHQYNSQSTQSMPYQGNPQPTQGTVPPYANPNYQSNPGQNPPYYGYYPNQGGAPYHNQGFGYGGVPVNPTSPNRKKKKTVIILIVVILSLIALLVGSLCAVVYKILSESDTDFKNYFNNSSVQYGDDWGIGDDGDITDPNNSGLDVLDQPDIDVNDYSAQAAFQKLSPSVVGIECFEKALTMVDEDAASEGTGIVVDKNGYIVTNSHVIGDSKSLYSVYVTLSNGEQYEARIVGFDTKTDLAVLKIKPKSELTAASFADSEQISIGQDVIAIGNPGGSEYSNSITKGIISATDRSVSNYSYVNYIQTDAAINPGNSGGPLANLYGQVIGINTIKIVNEEYEGMGFAIPSNTVKKICDDLITRGYVSGRVRIGITGQEISAAVSDSYGVPSGILIIGFSADSPFNGTKAKAEDIITAFNGVEISTFSELYKELDKYKPGDKVTVTLYRASSQASTFDVTITLLADLGETQITE